MVESAGKSTEDHDLVLHLRYNLAEVLDIGMGNAYPVRPGFKVGETGDTFHEVGRILVPLLDDSNTLKTQHFLLNLPGTL